MVTFEVNGLFFGHFLRLLQQRVTKICFCFSSKKSLAKMNISEDGGKRYSSLQCRFGDFLKTLFYFWLCLSPLSPQFWKMKEVWKLSSFFDLLALTSLLGLKIKTTNRTLWIESSPKFTGDFNLQIPTPRLSKNGVVPLMNSKQDLTYDSKSDKNIVEK